MLVVVFPAYRLASVRIGAENEGEVCAVPSVSVSRFKGMFCNERDECETSADLNCTDGKFTVKTNELVSIAAVVDVTVFRLAPLYFIGKLV